MTSPSPAEGSNGARALAFFRALSRSTMDEVDRFYAPDVHFEDPMVSLHGRDRMRAYYASIYRNDPQLRWEFDDLIEADDALALAWTMHLQVKGLAGGRPIAVAGFSRLHFDSEGQCRYHRDYFDMGAFVYEHLPVLGTVIGLVKRRLHHAE